MIKTKAASSLQDADVLAKRASAVQWCTHATKYAVPHGGKPWKYVLIPHDAVAENMTLAGLAQRYGCA